MSSPSVPDAVASSLSTPRTARLWGAILSMALCSFALVASEFMPVSLLTPIAQTLALSEGQAGQAISFSGLFAVLTALFVSALIGRLDRKPVILALTALMIVSGALVAFAPTYTVLMFGRALLGIAIGGSWSMSTSVLMRIAPPAWVPRAIALIQGGAALATAVAAPLGSFLGGWIGWRGAFFCVVPLAAIALCWQAVTLPSMPFHGRARRLGDSLRLLGTLHMSLGMAALTCLFMGQFMLYTYLRPFLETVTGVDVSTLSLLLLGLGVCGLAGTLLVGSLLAHGLFRVLASIPLLMAACGVALVLLGAHLWPVALLLAAWGLTSTAAPVGWFTWLSRTLPDDAETGGGLMVAIIQLAITFGATFGGLLYDLSGYRATFLSSAAVLVLAALLALVAARLDRMR